ncbi:unnamed protein product, partial [Acanthocheilonema viteae]
AEEKKRVHGMIRDVQVIGHNTVYTEQENTVVVPNITYNAASLSCPPKRDDSAITRPTGWVLLY